MEGVVAAAEECGNFQSIFHRPLDSASASSSIRTVASPSPFPSLAPAQHFHVFWCVPLLLSFDLLLVSFLPLSTSLPGLRCLTWQHGGVCMG